MNIQDWLAAAIADAERRGMPELRPLLETLARSTANLREADRLPRVGLDGEPETPPGQ